MSYEQLTDQPNGKLRILARHILLLHFCVAQRSYPNPSITYQPSYDNLGRITSADTGTGYAKFDYQYGPNTNNISRQAYDHRTNDPCTLFSYDNLDRLTMAEYGIGDNNEIFTMDDLGNRSNVNVRGGSDIAYSIDNLTNRYDSVGDYRVIKSNGDM